MDAFVDPSYEYDAPMFVDFSKGTEQLDPEADKWFDEKGADDGGVFIEEEPNDQESNEPTDTVNKMASEVPKDDTRKTPSQTEEEPGNLNPLANEESANESPPKKQVPKNIVTSWSDWVAKTTTSVNKETKENTTTSTSQSDQESNEPTDPVNEMASEIPEIPKEDTRKTPPQTEEEPENLNPLANEESAKESPKKQVPKNIVTSWSDWVAKTTTSVSNKEPEKSTTTSTSPPRVKRKREKKEHERRSIRLRIVSTCSTASTVSNSSDGCPVARKVPKIKAPLALTVPTTPTFMRKAPQSKTAANQAPKTKEENELQVIAQKQKETMEKLRQNKISMKKALAGRSYMPCRSAVDNLTRPQEFHFATDDRLGPSAQSTHASATEDGKNFVGTLRQHPPSPTFKNRKPTVPMPFKMTESKKRKEPDNDDNTCGQYQSMAQKVYQWQKKTPERFHVKSVQEQNQGPSASCMEKTSQKLTAPKTPNLTAKERKRPLPSDCMSQEEQERQLEAEMKSYKFKATELNRKIFDCNGTLGVYMEPKKPLTEIEPFNFDTEQRAVVHKIKEEPLNEEENHPRQIKAQPLPDFSNVFKPELSHSSTHSQPFSFEHRDKELKQRKEEKIKTVLEEEIKLHKFHAQPLPSFTPPALPSSSKVLTEPAPFNLSTENRGAVKAEKWGQQLQQEIQLERMKRVFKARPTNVLYNAPFVPDKSTSKPSTKIEEFSMNCDKRAKEREIYEMHKTERELEEEEARRQLEKEREEEEKIYIKSLRKQLVHKPNPIRKYRSVEIKQSEKELTEPHSPEWQSKKRRKLRV